RQEKRGFEGGIHEKPTESEYDPAVQKILDYVGAPVQSSIQGVEAGVDKIGTGVSAIGEGDIAGGIAAIINGTISTGFGAATPFVPVLAGFAIANRLAEDVGLTEQFETFMSPFSKTVEDQVAQEISRLKSEGKSPEEISKQLGVSLSTAKGGKTILGREAAEFADLVYNLALFHKVSTKVGKTKALFN
ncbi:unnamed protein product, partial [marine sediment metagenome]